MAYQYVNKQESLLAKVSGRTGRISDRTHLEHLKLYSSLVQQTNGALKRLEELLLLLDPSTAGGHDAISAEYRQVKQRFNQALCGTINHELYFSILGGKGGAPEGKLAELIVKSFGSFELFLRDLKATALLAGAWVWTGFDPTSSMLFNYLGDADCSFPALGVRPILAVDLAEHAYFPDFGWNRADYVEEWLNAMDWEMVAQNLELD